MSLIYANYYLPVNTSTTTTTIAAISSTTSTTTPSSTTTISASTNVSDPMREEAMDVVVAKIISLLILTILSVLCGLLPLRLLIHTPHLFTRSRGSVDYFLCGLRLFSGGIYLATCFLHLMPDTRDKMAAVMLNMGSRTTYAVPELLVMSGFYAVVFVEQIIQALYVKAQESDTNRKRRKAKKKEKEIKQQQQLPVYRSTLDEESGPGGQQTQRKVFSDDEDDDDDDDVLVEDEDDLSFNDTDSEKQSVDSATQVKENLLDHAPTSDSVANHRNKQLIQLKPTHSHPLSLPDPQGPQNQVVCHSKANYHHETGTQVLRTFLRPSLDALSKTTTCDSRSYQNSGPPVIHMHQQQLSPLRSLKQNHFPHNHHDHHHHQHQHHHHHHHQQQPQQQPPPQQQPLQQPHQEQQPPQQEHQLEISSSTPSLKATTSPQHDQLQQTVKPAADIMGGLPVTRIGPQYPVINHQCSQDESDDDSEICSPNNTCQVSVCVEGETTINGESLTLKTKDINNDKDVDSGVFSTRRDCEITECESRKFTQSTSREVSFDRISESSSVLQDIQVKRVVDELSRTDDSSRAHFRSIIYIMALSFHGIFEGMALGLQSMKSSVWALCFAIVVHRCVLAFKLGMDLCKGEEKQGTAFLCIGTFTLISTLGIIIGVLISSGASLYSDVTVPEAILQSLATGTIFYIVFFDILFKDLEGKDDLKRVSSSFVGFSLMAIVFAITRS